MFESNAALDYYINRRIETLTFVHVIIHHAHNIQIHFLPLFDCSCFLSAYKGSCDDKDLSPLSFIFSMKVKKTLCVLVQHGLCSFSSGRKGPGCPTEYHTSPDWILRILRYPRYIYTAKTLYGDTGELIIEELLQRGDMTMSSTVKTVADRLTQNMEGQYLSVVKRHSRGEK